MAELPDGAAVPAGGPLAGAGDRYSRSAGRTFSVYVHVPFCRVRCGYCDFNTYTSGELGGGADQAAFRTTAAAEIAHAAGILREAGVANREVATVFFGGGTPTILPAGDLADVLSAIRDTWGIADGAEITTEANPDSVDERYLAALAEAGFTRVSVGMQSAVPHVLATLDRTHTPANVPAAVAAARGAGLNVSVDLIYGTPGESVDDWRQSVDAALELGTDHISAYALGIEEGTRMGAQLRRGEISPADPDDQALKYEIADEAFTAAGYPWYEISNWARPGHESAHNRAYWRSQDWWGVGPGAHSHVDGVRFWNAKHPRAWAGRVLGGESPAVGRELLGPDAREFERVMLEIRLAEGYDVLERDTPGGRATRREMMVARLGRLAEEGLADAGAARDFRLVLTRRGRLLADAVTRELTDVVEGEFGD